jgi:hypothetical protein
MEKTSIATFTSTEMVASNVRCKKKPSEVAENKWTEFAVVSPPCTEWPSGET